ncbi:MAG: putative short-subunit dehydrogenase-like oxidoreductase (DUF2520 family) [Candidatus Endobugula sp.]|jgi:predicted short-subunit dehydrogenase-like oxidoreductase (DUF2520 family)
MINKPTLSIIGPGKVGTTIAIAAMRSQQYEVIIGSRNITKDKNTSKWLGDDIIIIDMHTAATMGDIVLLTVADDSIKTVCDQLAHARMFKADALVAHCSGALTSEALKVAKERCDTHVASMHPLQTFPSIAAALDRLSETYCYYEADIESKKRIQQLIKNLGMRPIEIQKNVKNLYHASAVVACNYFAALIETSLELGEAAGIDRDTLWTSLEPLVSATLDNIKQNGPANALTGPIARGDINTVERHLLALKTLSPPKKAERLAEVYSAMGIQTVSLAKKKGYITQQAESHFLNQLEHKPQ